MKAIPNPDRLEEEYKKLLLVFVGTIHTAAKNEIFQDYLYIKSVYEEELKQDAESHLPVWLMILSNAFNRVKDKVSGFFNSVVNRISTLPRAYKTFIGSKFKKVLGKPELAQEIIKNSNMEPLIQGWIAQNVTLVTKLKDDIYADIEGIIRRGVMEIKTKAQIAEDLKKNLKISENRAILIAEDQHLKLTAQINQYLYEKGGSESYIWRTQRDNRVRPEHADREGKIFKWNRPPQGGHPGMAIRCRCFAQPIFKT